ncbi:CoA-binding protein [Paraherbaspirillum soli]|uniref:CoA-binding protein n=1 Tax=Paraherbaspirillum soli TaxID=631222 RepID=A0ABW0M4Z3_9BURK
MSAASTSNTLSKNPLIAVVGLSRKPDRPSFEVASYLQEHGYRIIPVNPMYAGTEVLGERCYSDLLQASQALAVDNLKIDIVDCFRRSEDIPPVVDQAIAIGASCVWMQLGIVNEAAAVKARAAGLQVVMDHCIKIEHSLGNFHGVL